MEKILGIDAGSYQMVVAKIGVMGSLEHKRVLSCVVHYRNASNEILKHVTEVSRNITENRVMKLYFSNEFLQDHRDLWVYGSTALEFCEEPGRIYWPFQEENTDQPHAVHKAGVALFKKVYEEVQASHPSVVIAVHPGCSKELENRIVQMAKDAGAQQVTSFCGASLDAHWIINVRKINRIIVVDIGAKATDICIAPNVVSALASGYSFSTPIGWERLVDFIQEKVQEAGYVVQREKVIRWLCESASLLDEFAEISLGSCQTVEGKFQLNANIEIGEAFCEAGSQWLAEIAEFLIDSLSNCGKKGSIRGEERDTFLKRIFITGAIANIEGMVDIFKQHLIEKLELPPGITIVQTLGQINEFLPAMAGLRYGEGQGSNSL